MMFSEINSKNPSILLRLKSTVRLSQASAIMVDSRIEQAITSSPLPVF